MWWCTSVILALGRPRQDRDVRLRQLGMVAVHLCAPRRLRQEDYDFTASLDDLEDEDKKKNRWKKEEEEEEGEKGRRREEGGG